jgi:hypothetical protein
MSHIMNNLCCSLSAVKMRDGLLEAKTRTLTLSLVRERGQEMVLDSGVALSEPASVFAHDASTPA